MNALPGLLRLAAVVLWLAAPPALIAQDAPAFDPIAAAAELESLRAGLGTNEVDNEFLNQARARALQVSSTAEGCAAQSGAERVRLEARYEPLREVDADVAPAVFDQRNEIRRQLDEAIARETACIGVRDNAAALIAAISGTQTRLSQQFLFYRSEDQLSALTETPDRLRGLPERIRNANRPELVNGIDAVELFWYLIAAGIFAAGLGIFLRHRFAAWYEKAGGDDAIPQLRLLFPKPLAQYAPAMLSGMAFVATLVYALEQPSLELVVMRIALGVLLFGLGCVVIDWATGPLSPSADVNGLIPDHVKPLRRRLRILILALVASFILLGTNWLSIRLVDPDVTGRAAMILVVALCLFNVFAYLRRIPGLRHRLRVLRYLAMLTLIVAIAAVLVGYQNFAGYLIHGVTRTSLALFTLWILFWLISRAFDYLIRDDTPAAQRARENLGLGKSATRTGLGFMQLVADLVLWIGAIVYLIYVWDESGTTIDRLVDLVILGGTVGNLRLIPAQIIGGVLVFAGLLVLIGWLKRWIDRRWLQHIVAERGAREALITLFGYVGFVIALLIGLTQAGVDLSGIAIVSGALALGIGFGMQEIANNFVSGLILLFERPIRSGDFVTVGDTEGFVRRISIRATEIETLDNQNVMVPNSELVSGRVTNWVLHDTQGRIRLFVGVAYGSDVEKVRNILERIANEHPEVITDGRAPAPRALFMGFGDSSLDFELRCRVNRIDRRFTVMSDMNFAINAGFRAENIEIPFPQRDLHIRSYPDFGAGKEAAVAPPPAPEETERSLPQLEVITRFHSDETRIAADIRDVWRALTDIESMKTWLGAEGTFSPFIGGAYDLQLKDGDRRRGHIDIFVPPYRMRLVEGPREGEEPLATGPMTVEFTLREREGQTLLTVRVAGIPATEDWEEDYNRSVVRWQNALVELQELLTRK
ncbi:MAG: mechanosensitive ion channel [Gammaproteobacteria bacterium]|nr:mechanosensitive ion channel [Gammaproteobacteria bacterium]MDH4254574.1 mechanosensitive ion channel [Gammaproteobacteria bacterium]MDH5311040.1 mechanosensitive ion channel [Gammaproteobacteria bacterium]